ncbi:hypothetical protein ACN2MM_06505 [Alkalilimnicola ehrlichii MLHE-1]|uniref:Uncharacterized protein n=1 Tax=Alkalilimnicola ehrlichii (strain ATCC BAA-1101 / DSM 17681 / MLHE-1) TaxID=187272 RepID=Q0A9G7_ALKEH|nr:hypothetical protein [Alkalilimnicola ehrlichii]ABI56520.1 hypothetical protein Mlg_1171 [Alkalilimnicola ehrlichii MLHE-1]
MRTLPALILAALFTVAYIALLYALVTWLWPLFPPWLKLIGFILLAVFAIGSPLLVLARLARRHPETGARLVRLLGGKAPPGVDPTANAPGRPPRDQDSHKP